MSDTITVLRSQAGIRLTKLWRGDGTIEGYEDAKTFTFEQHDVDSLDSLYATLLPLAPKPDRCVIRGTYKAALAGQKVQRNTESTVDLPHHWLMIDIDKFEPLLEPFDAADPVPSILEFVETCLPQAFRDRSFIWQLSSSAGHPTAGDAVKAHLWFWCERPYDSTTLREWAKLQKHVDPAVMRVVQPHYTADPVIEMPDDLDPWSEAPAAPVAKRMGLWRGGADVVQLDLAASTGGALGGFDADGEVDLSYARDAVADYDLDRVRDELLVHLDPNMHHDEWVMIGMALHHQGDGDPEWLNLWDDWSSHGASYSEGVCEERWPSFKDERTAGTGSVTLRYILKLVKAKLDKETRKEQTQQVRREVAAAKEARPELDSELEKAKAAIAAAQSYQELELDVIPPLRLIAFSDVDRSVLTDLVRERFKALGARMNLSQVKKMLMPPPGRASGSASWTSDWAYVERDKKVFNLKTRELLDKDTFNQVYTHRVPLAPGQASPTPAYNYIQQFEKKLLVATVMAPPKDTTFMHAGLEFANVYRPDRVPVEVDEIDEDGRPHVEAIERFFRVLVPDERERGILLSWLAHNVRKPGVKVGWAPYLHSNVHGAGKTTIAELMSIVLGTAVAIIPGNKALNSRFSGWEVDNILVLLDEFPTAKHSQFNDIDPYETLKGIITGHEISIERKGRDAAQGLSFCNIMLASNNIAGIRVSENDRRLFYVSVPMTKEEHAAHEKAGLYASVRAAMRYAGPVLRRWFMDLPVHPEFVVGGRAPVTAARAEAVELSKSNLRTEIEELLDKTGPGYDRTVVSTPHIKDVLVGPKGERRESLGQRAVDLVLKEIGFRAAGRAKIAGRLCTIWTTATREEGELAVLAERVRSTLQADADDSFLD